jgi:hypothetical protein
MTTVNTSGAKARAKGVTIRAMAPATLLVAGAGEVSVARARFPLQLECALLALDPFLAVAGRPQR